MGEGEVGEIRAGDPAVELEGEARGRPVEQGAEGQVGHGTGPPGGAGDHGPVGRVGASRHTPHAIRGIVNELTLLVCHRQVLLGDHLSAPSTPLPFQEHPVTVLVLIGSLRAASDNRRLATAAAGHLPAGTHTPVSGPPRRAAALLRGPRRGRRPRGRRRPAPRGRCRRRPPHRHSRVQRVAPGLGQERHRLAVAAAGSRGARRQRHGRHRRDPIPTWRPVGTRGRRPVLTVAGATVLEPTVGVGGAHEAFDDETTRRPGRRRRPADLMGRLGARVATAA